MVRVDVLLHGEPVDAFSTIVQSLEGVRLRKKMTERLRELIPGSCSTSRSSGDRFEDHRARDGQGEAQGRAGQVLRRRHHAQAEALGGAEEGEGWLRKVGGWTSAGGVHRRAPGGEGGQEVSASVEPAGIYVHVLFCLTRCGYCDFNAYAGLDHLASRYVAAVLREAELAAPGGGRRDRECSWAVDADDPEVADLKALLARVRSAFEVSADAEVTVEANPDTVDEAKLAGLREAGFGRLSMGAQSFDRTVRGAGAVHQPESVAKAFRAARAAATTT